MNKAELDHKFVMLEVFYGMYPQLMSKLKKK